MGMDISSLLDMKKQKKFRLADFHGLQDTEVLKVEVKRKWFKLCGRERKFETVSCTERKWRMENATSCAQELFSF